jgi:hypothetical protein
VTDGPTYVLDADVFITAARSYYAFEVAPAFWEGLIRQATSGRLLSIDRVEDEIQRGKDDLVKWAKGTFHPWFASTAQDDVIGAYREVMRWAQAQSQFFDYAKDEFAQGADGWLVAYAKAKACVVVTKETFEPAIRRKIKIPNVCRVFDVPYVDTFQMLRALGIKLG